MNLSSLLENINLPKEKKIKIKDFNIHIKRLAIEEFSKYKLHSIFATYTITRKEGDDMITKKIIDTENKFFIEFHISNLPTDDKFDINYFTEVLLVRANQITYDIKSFLNVFAEIKTSISNHAKVRYHYNFGDESLTIESVKPYLLGLSSLLPFDASPTDKVPQSIEQQQTIHVVKTRTSPNNNNDFLHRIANEFSSEVGSKLKSNYPSTVDNIDVKCSWNGNEFVLTYSCDIIKCEVGEHFLYFDHRGGMAISQNKQTAITTSSNNAKQQLKISAPKWQQTYDGVAVYGLVNTTSTNNMVWLSVSENFIMAR